MAISSKIKGQSHKKISSGLQHHQERFSEKEGLEALKNTDSKIDVSQTKFNQLLFKSDELQGRSVRKFVSEEFEKVNTKRKEMGKRAYRPDSNTIGMGNFQISDDSLALLGYDKSKKWDEQSKQAQDNVIIAYKRLVNNAIKKPDIYGKVLTASLHVDESTPHVDFLTTGLDAERPDWSLREVLNGKEWRDENGKRRFPPRGSKLSAMQDDINTVFNETERERFKLERGMKKSERFDFAKQTRKAEKLIKQESKALDEKEINLSKRKQSLDKRETNVEARESVLDARERELREKEAKLKQGVSESLREAQSALARVKEENERLEQEAALKRAEIARLDRVILDKRDEANLDYLKNTLSKNVPGKTQYEVVDGNRQEADKQRLLSKFGNIESESISSKSNNDIGLSY
jgi:hypothetical protein